MIDVTSKKQQIIKPTFSFTPLPKNDAPVELPGNAIFRQPIYELSGNMPMRPNIAVDQLSDDHASVC